MDCIATGGYGGVFIIDVSDPEEPRVINRLKVGNVKKVFSYQNFVFAASDSGIKILNVSDPAKPHLVKELNIGKSIKDSHVKENHIYMLTDESLVIADISIPEDPMILGKMSIAGKIVYTTSNRAYIASDSGDVLVVDVSDPIDPKILGKFTLGEDIREIRRTGEDLTFFLTKDKLIVADLPDP